LALPTSVVFEGDVIQVGLPGSEGYLTILPDHEAMVGVLRPGIIKALTVDREAFNFFVRDGFMDISSKEVLVSGTKAIPESEITHNFVFSELRGARISLDNAVTDVDRLVSSNTLIDLYTVLCKYVVAEEAECDRFLNMDYFDF